MTTLQWHFPTALDEALSFMKEGLSPHAGGTWLMKQKPKKGFFDLSRISELYRWEKNNGMLEAGSMHTFASFSGKLPKDHILNEALSAAASNTLRNRITLGGSLAAFPVWSDLAAPLVLLEAEVLLAGADRTAVSVLDYLSSADTRKASLVSGVRLPTDVQPARYFRQVRVTFDYPAFTIAALRLPDGTVRAVVGGTKKRISLYEGEEAHKAKPEIPGRFGFSGTYLSHCAAVELSRLINNLEEDLR